ncbi:MAG: ADP-ribosylation factor-like protein [Candidatus Heimdallarchaeota archaeon]
MQTPIYSNSNIESPTNLLRSVNKEFQKMDAFSRTQKVLLMGLGASGKSSIRAVVFEGKTPDDVKDYHATINYTRSTKNIINTAFQIFDCGGQESFLSVFVGEQAEFIFTDVEILVWVVDVSDFDQVSTSKFYFTHAINKLNEYSPRAVAFCLLHKTDLLLPHMKDEVTETLKEYFVPPKNSKIQIRHYNTSIFENSIFRAIGDLIQTIILKKAGGGDISQTIQQFIEMNKELSGITVYTEDGLPIFEEGPMAHNIMIPANLWLTNYERITADFASDETLKTILETNDYLFVFQRIQSELVLNGIARKVAPLQYLLVKMDSLAEMINALL